MIKISIILPVYNVEKYILTCLSSIIQQSYKNIEIIIVDDCGTDNSMKIVKEYIKTSSSTSNIHIIQHEFNKGISAARNTGIKYSTGDYIYFMDSDDYISPNCIKSFVDVVHKYQAIDIIFGSAKYIPHKWKDTIISVNSKEIPEYIQERDWICKHLFSKEQYFPITVWNKLISKNYIIKNNLFFKEGIIHEDNLWNWHMANSVKSIAFNKEITYFYQYRPYSIVNKPYDNINMDSEVIIIKEMFRSITSNFFFRKFISILHFSHSSYCRRQGDKPLPPAYIRYPKAFIFFIKCLFMKPEKLR